MKIHSKHLKSSLLHYFRYKRQFICCDEVDYRFGGRADILVDTGTSFIEVETKTSYNDLYNEKNKIKHNLAINHNSLIESKKLINYFYLCVPTELLEQAEKWILKVNPKYGLIHFLSKEYCEKAEKNKVIHFQDYITIYKKAECLQPFYNVKLKDFLIKRLSSAVCINYRNNLLLPLTKQ